MRTRIYWAFMTAMLALGVPGCVEAPSAGPGATPERAETRAFHTLLEDDWQWSLADAPGWASSVVGDRRFDAKWDDPSLAAEARREAHDRDSLGRITRIDRAKLSAEDALSYDVFRYRAQLAVEGHAYHLYLMPITQQGGIQTADELADELPFATRQSFVDWNARLAAFPPYVDATLEVLAEGVHQRLTHARVVMQRVTAQIDAQIVTDPAKSPFFAPYTHPSAALPEAERTRLAEEAKQLIATRIVPSFQKLREFWTKTYLPACTESVGAWQWPNGEALYAYTARLHTTTNATPDAIHALGLREVARIRGEMEKEKTRTGFTGSLREFFTFLRTDPRFFFKSGAELLVAYRDLAKRVDPQLVKAFSRLPRTPYGVSPIPDATAPDTYTAYYREPSADGSRAGTFFVNLYKPESRPKWEMTALTLHESVPGHHLQIALAQEQKDLPEFRRHGDYTAFVEGWALYAETLGEEMGLYEDPYAKFGQLTYEMWRAVRLVVDTGIHHLKWDRQRAIDFFMENAAKTELDVTNEVDRYIAWPGQALAYKMGELKIKELRQKKKAATGGPFDEKAFHESVLHAGPLPLEILERELLKPEVKPR